MERDVRLWDFHQNENRTHLNNGYFRQNLLFKYILKYLSPWSSILELWFWDGYLLNRLFLYWFNVIWQDISEANINMTKNQWKLNDSNFVLWSTNWNIIYANSSLDWFIASEVLEHMTDSQLLMTVSEINRVLKVGGFAFLTFPAEENLKHNECICPDCWSIFHKWWHKQYWDMEKIKKIFSWFKIIYIWEKFNRFQWNNFIENIIWWIMYVLRNLLKRIINLNWRSYYVILMKD